MSAMKIKASDYIAKFLRAQQVDCVFEVAGGMITNILDALYLDGYVKIISVHHEQAAAFAADAYGRRTGKPGVAMATSGPGATNLLTGIASCYFDSSPALFITGQVNLHEQKGGSQIRQLGFQETDIVAMAEPITKKCFRITQASQLESTLKQAYEIAISDRPGPVLIDIPMNVQRVELDVEPIIALQRKTRDDFFVLNNLGANDPGANDLFAAIKKAKKPLILGGGGINSARALEPFLKFAELLQIPVVTSLQAIDVIPFDHPLRVGFIGSYGNRWANLAIGAADLLLVIGSRLDIRQTGADIAGFSANKVIFHVDCDEHEVNNRIKNCIPIIADIKQFIHAAMQEASKNTFTAQTAWLDEINTLRAAWPDTQELKNITCINPNIFVHDLSRACKQAAGFVVDVGSHQMWAAQSLEIQSNQFFMTSGGMGAMGFSLPAAIGACFSGGKKPVVVIVGDGSLQMNIQELQTVVRNKLPLKIVVLNNRALGMIRQFQDSYFEGRHQSTYWGYSAPDFVSIANAYGISAHSISMPEDIPSGINRLWEDSDQPALLQVMLDPHLNVYPKIAFGKPITEMEPFATPDEMEGT